MVETRNKNTAIHPGIIDAPRIRHSSEAVASEKKAKADKKVEVAALQAATRARITELETQLKAEQLKMKQAGGKPPVSTQKKARVATGKKARVAKKGVAVGLNTAVDEANNDERPPLVCISCRESQSVIG
jgi:hypothetical protein